MSHSKMTKRGRSQYVESWNPDAKRFINTCLCCGMCGYSPALDDEDFADISKRREGFAVKRTIRDELRSIMKAMPLDELGRCPDCKRAQEKLEAEKKNNK